MFKSKRDLFSVVCLILLAITVAVWVHQPGPLEGQTVSTGEQAQMKLLYGHMAADFLHRDWVASDTTAANATVYIDYTWIPRFYNPDSTTEWLGPCTEVVCAVDSTCTLTVYGDPTHFIDEDDPIVLKSGESLTISARAESINFKSGYQAQLRAQGFGD